MILRGFLFFVFGFAAAADPVAWDAALTGCGCAKEAASTSALMLALFVVGCGVRADEYIEYQSVFWRFLGGPLLVAAADAEGSAADAAADAAVEGTALGFWPATAAALAAVKH